MLFFFKLCSDSTRAVLCDGLRLEPHFSFPSLADVVVVVAVAVVVVVVVVAVEKKFSHLADNRLKEFLVEGIINGRKKHSRPLLRPTYFVQKSCIKCFFAEVFSLPVKFDHTRTI